MRPGLQLAGGLAASALLLLGALVAFEVTGPSTAEAGAPLSWQVAPPAQVPRPPAPAGAAPRRPLRLVVPRAPQKRPLKVRLQPKAARLGAAVPANARVTPARAARPAARTAPRTTAPRTTAPRTGANTAARTANAFRVWLEPSPQTPHGYAYADALRAALARQGAVAARRPGRVIWSVDHEFVARLNDGSPIAVVGGYGVTELSFRHLTPGVCRLVFGAAEGAHAFIAYPGAVLQPPHSGPTRGPTSSQPVTDARALCARLGPAFDAWRRAAPTGPLDLADLDRREISISPPGGGSAPGQRGSAKQALFY